MPAAAPVSVGAFQLITGLIPSRQALPAFVSMCVPSQHVGTSLPSARWSHKLAWQPGPLK